VSKIVFLFLVFQFAVLTAIAGEPAGTNKTTITSGRLTFDYKRYTAEFEKDVVVIDPNMKMKSDTLNVIFDNESNIKQAVAVGNVHLCQQDKTGTCDRVVYVAKTGEVMMIGNARIKRGEDVIKGNKITFWLNDDRMECTPGSLEIISKKGANNPVGNPRAKK